MADDEPAGATQTEVDIANSGPAPWINRFIVIKGPMVRIAFLEQATADGPTFFRNAVTMSHADAIALKNLLNGMLADLE